MQSLAYRKCRIVANRALDWGSFHEVNVQEVAAFVSALGDAASGSIGISFSFDGASRGNPGRSSSGVCAWWGRFHATSSGRFESQGSLLQKGVCIGTSTNNIAEAHGMASALKVCLRYYSAVIEQLSQLAQHTVRYE